MTNDVKLVRFNTLNINDNFFDSLKNDYKEFENWFERKSSEGKEAYVIKNNEGYVQGFLYLKEECEQIELIDRTLPEKNRLKLGTFKLDEAIEGTRNGEKFVGLALQKLLALNYEEAYVTVFEKHEGLIILLESFGFNKIGVNFRGEQVMIRVLKNDETGKKNYPLIKFNQPGKYLFLMEHYHDKFFPEAQLANTNQNTDKVIASNGISKVYIYFKNDINNYYSPNTPLLIYRMAREHKIYKSVVSSIGMVESIHTIKNNYTQCVTQEEFLSIVGNKSIFSENELLEFYKKKDIVVIKFIFNAAFGEGCNVNNATLRENGYWTTGRMHPQALDFSKEDFVTIGQLGGADVQHFITD